jgi:hypothetical protein
MSEHQELPTREGPSAAAIVFLNIEVTPNAIVERDGRQRLAVIAAEDVRGIEAAHGFTAERLALQVLFASALLALGLYLGGALVPWIVEAEVPRYGGRALLGAIFFLMFGGWTLWQALRRGHYLRITTRSGVRKLHLRGNFTPEQLSAFLESAHRAIQR